MKQSSLITLGSLDRFRVWDRTPVDLQFPVVEIEGGSGHGDARIFFRSVDQLRMCRDVLSRWLAEHDTPDGSADRRDIVPADVVIAAEAVTDSPREIVDADELLATMAESYDVRRSEWPDPATGRRNCPGEVP